MRNRSNSAGHNGWNVAAEVMEQRALLSGPQYSTGFSAQFASYGGAPGICGPNRAPGGPNGGPWDTGMVNDSSGNLYINGSYSGTGNINPFGTPYTLTNPLVTQQPFVAKYDSNLNLQWIMNPAQYSTTTTATAQYFSNIVMDPVAGNIYVNGPLLGTMTLPTATGTWSVTASSNTNFVMGLDRNTGNLVWFAEYAPTISSLATDGSGNLYMETTITSATAAPWTYLYGPGTGGSPITFNTTASGSSVAAFVKCDSSGNIVWSGNFSTSTGSAGARSMAVDQAGNIYFGGGFSGTVDLDPGPGVKNVTATFGSGDGIIVKIGANGNLAWIAHNTLFTNNCTDILVDCNGNVDAGWYYQWAVSVTVTGKKPHQTTTVVGGDLTQFDNNGNLKWYANPNTSTYSDPGAMLLDPAGNIYMNSNKITSYGELTKYSSAGNLVWNVPDYGYPIYSINIDPLGDIWTNGGSGGATPGMSFDVSPTSTPVYLPWNSTWPMMLVKWTQPGGFAAAATQQSAGTLTSSSSLTKGPATPTTANTVTQPVIYVGDVSLAPPTLTDTYDPTKQHLPLLTI